MKSSMKWTTLFMMLVCAALAFGGTFNCHGDTGSFSTSSP